MLPPVIQGKEELGILGITLVKGHPRKHDAVGHGPVPQFQGDSPLGPMHHLRGDVRLPATLPIRRPLFRQEQIGIQQAVKIARDVTQVDRDDAVLHLAHPATPLPLDPRGLPAFFDMPALVEYPNRAGVNMLPCHPLLQQVANAKMVPPIKRKKLLQATRLHARRLGHGLHALTLQVRHLALDIRPEVRRQLAAAKTCVEILQKRSQSLLELPNLRITHVVAPLLATGSVRSHRLTVFNFLS